MGLLKAALGAAGGVLADSWREYFYCDAMPAGTLACKGAKRTSGRSSNTSGESNVISNGAVIAVNEGQAMMIVDQGKVVEFSAEPGEFTWDSSTQPSLFYGDLGKNISASFEQFGRRFGFGGDTGTDQRVYFFNLKEVVGNKYGTPTPIPVRVVDQNIGLDLDASVRCNGEYSYKIVDPMLFYGNVCGNFEGSYTREKIDSQMKSELLAALQPAFSKISALGIRYSAIPGHTTEVCEALDEVLSDKWTKLRGIKIVSFGCNSISASEEDEKMIKELQRAASLGNNPNIERGYMAGATGAAMQAAAANESAGAVMGMMGMGMASNMGSNAYANVPRQEAAANAYGVAADGGFGAAQASANSWTCSCGKVNTGKFCAECGAPKPQPPEQWTCSCGAVNTGKFCPECGAAKPAPGPEYKCDKCGWVPEDPTNPPKFCPECGDPFGEEDQV